MSKLQDAINALNGQLDKAESYVVSQVTSAKQAVSEEIQQAKQTAEWFWGLLQGDFNEEQTPSQVITNAGISITLSATGVGILVAWMLDFRDFCACCYHIHRDGSKSGSFKANDVGFLTWFMLVIMLVGIVPAFGDLLKGVLRIIYLEFRIIAKTTSNLSVVGQFIKAVEASMPYIRQLLGHEKVRQYLAKMGWHRPYMQLAKALKDNYSKVKDLKKIITEVFDPKIKEFKQIYAQIKNYLPKDADQKYQALLNKLMDVRNGLNEKVSALTKPLQDCIDILIIRLEKEDMEIYKATSGRFTTHYYGLIKPGTEAWNEARRLPFLVSRNKNPEMIATPDQINYVNKMAQQGYPKIHENTIKTFAKNGMRADVLKGPMRLYRVVSPDSRADGAFWVTESVFRQLKSRNDWRDKLAVKVEWSANGQYVTLDLKSGETLKVWRGPAASQKFDDSTNLWYAGGVEQIVFFPNPSRVSARQETSWGYTDIDKQLLNNRVIINLDGTAKK